MIVYSATAGGFFSTSIHGSSIPSDAVEISSEEYYALLDGQSAGSRIVPNDNGRPVLLEPSPVSAATRRATIKVIIDTAAGSARARYVSAGQLIEEEYRLALQQTQQWRAAGSPSDSVPQAIQDWADAANITAEEAVVSIEQTDAAWQQVLLNIRQARLAGKAAIDAAPDDADFIAIAQPYIDQLAAMQP